MSGCHSAALSSTRQEVVPNIPQSPHREQERFTGALRRAHNDYDAAAMLRRWYRDMTGEIPPDSDELSAWPDVVQ